MEGHDSTTAITHMIARRKPAARTWDLRRPRPRLHRTPHPVENITSAPPASTHTIFHWIGPLRASSVQPLLGNDR